MRGGRLRFLALALLALPFGAALPLQAQEKPATPPVLASPILTVDRDRLYSETLYGKSVEAHFKAESDALIAENLRLEQALEAEERDLTDRRATLAPEEFKRLATAFDSKAEGIRAAQQAKSTAIAQKREAEQQRFLEAAIPVLGELMQSTGAAAIFDKNMIILSLRGIDITDAAIARIDAVLGDGGGAAPSAAPEPARPEAVQEKKTAPAPQPAP